MTTAQKGNAATAEVAARVRSKAAEQRVSVRALATKVGMDYSSMLRRTRGDVPLTIPELISIANALGVDVAALMPKKADAGRAVAS